MHAFLEMERSEICGAMRITQNNLSVLLHRARARLSDAIEAGRA